MSNPDRPVNQPEFADIKSISPNLITSDYLNLMWLDFSDFEWKKVASIWWWFWILEIDLAKKWNVNVEVIDPIYWSSELRERKRKETHEWLKQSYERRHEKNNILQESLERLEKELIKIRAQLSQVFDNDRLNTQQCYELYDNLSIKEQELQEKLEETQKLKERRDQLFSNKPILIQWLEERNSKIPGNIKLNPSYWENIEGIETGSKDIIFINHILHCFPNKLKQFLEQADKILSENGKIYIVDYYDYLENLQNYFKTNWTYKIDWWTICWSLKKWEYKEINF